MNLSFQLFTYDQTQDVLQLLQVVEGFVDDARKLKLIWLEHDGTRRSTGLGTLLNTQAGTDLKNGINSPLSLRSEFKLNEGYIPSMLKRIKPELKKLRLADLTVHFSISPACSVWASSTQPTATGKPKLRRVISSVQSVEAAAKHRKTKSFPVFPSVVEITLKNIQSEPKPAIDLIVEMVSNNWMSISCPGKFGVLDAGGDWLFFPTNGYNPNVAEISMYHSTESPEEWSEWRQRHNVTFEASGTRNSDARLLVLVHSLEVHRQP